MASNFLLLNLFQVCGTLFLATLFVLSVVGVAGVQFASVTVAAFGTATVSYVLLLLAPSRRWIRVFSVVAPVFAVGSRIQDVLAEEVFQPTALLVWGFLAFVFSWVAARMMPPPLSNGERRRWHREAGR